MVSMSLISLKDNHIIIFTDGAARGNPGPGGYAAVAIYPNAHGEPQIDELGGREDLTTNNRMELKAVIEGIKNFINYYQNLSDYSFTFYIDSGYVVKGATEWLQGWKQKNWISSTKEPVKNRDLWEELDRLLEQGDGKGFNAPIAAAGKYTSGAIRAGGGTVGVRKGAAAGTRGPSALKIEWKLIEGHAGVWGNERCDDIATSYADNKAMVDAGKPPLTLYTGPLAEYAAAIKGGENILNITAVNQARKDAMKARKAGSASRGVGADGKKAAAYSYVSMVGGKIETHKTWAECEARVKGKSGARFKKCFSQGEEAELIKDYMADHD